MLHCKLPDHWALLSGSEPFDEFSFQSNNVQIIFNNTTESWSDNSEHYHLESDEIYIVLEGSIEISVEGVRMKVVENEYLCVPKCTKHQLLSVETPHKSFVIRGPSVRDKIDVAT